MECKDELKNIDIKIRTSYHFDDIVTVKDIDLRDVLLDEKSEKNILIYDISYKTFMGSKPLRIRFDEIMDLLKFMINLIFSIIWSFVVWLNLW